MKQWPLNNAYFWETAPFFRVLLPFIAGIICYDTGVRLPIYYVVLLFIVAGVSFVFTSYRKLYRAIAFISLHLAIALGGWLLSYYQDIRNHPDWFGNQTMGTEAFVGVLEKDPQEKERTYRLEVSITATLEAKSISPSIGKAFIYVYKEKQPPALKTGDTILIPNKWQPIKNAGNPFEFDYAGYCQRNNILYQQFLSSSDLLKLNTNSPAIRTITIRAHDYCMQSLRRYIADTITRGIIQAMLVGDEADFDPELKQAYAETGIIHVIAISGSHLTVIFILISFLLSRIKSKKYHWIKYAVALPFIWFYVLMAGAPPSAVRAAAMFSLLATGFMLQKSNNSLNQLFATAFILLCAEPMWLFSIGFQLSFIAVLGLISFYTPIYRLYKPTNVAVRTIWATIAASLAAELLIAPLVVYYFHVFPVLFIIANIAAYIFMGIVLILGIAIILLSFIPPVATFIALISVFLTKIFNAIVILLQDWNPESFRYLQLSGIETLLLYTIIACSAIYAIRTIRPALLIGLAVTCLLISVLCYDEWIALHQERLVVYNLNRGSHIEYIKGKRHQVLYTDTATNPDKKKYVMNVAHIAWRAWEPDTINNKQAVLQIGNKTVFLLNGPSSLSQKFVADYLVINYPATIKHIIQLQQTYSPKFIIQSGHISRRAAEECKQLAAGLHINLHTTPLDGAYIIE